MFWRFWDHVQDSCQRKYNSHFFLITVHNLLCAILNKIQLSNSRAPNQCVLDAAVQVSVSGASSEGDSAAG